MHPLWSVYAYEANNCLTSYNESIPTFDADGNMTAAVLDGTARTFTYDSQNRLTQTDNDSYTYDAENYRIAAGQTTFTYDRLSMNLLIKTDASGKVTKYIYGNGLLGSESEDTYRTYRYDIRGSVTAITNESGEVTDRYSYSTYGKQTHNVGNSDEIFGYCGRDGVITEANGLLYMRARYYSPELKRS